MLGRRNLRIKVMQTLYGWQMDNEIPLTKLEHNLENKIKMSLVLYLTNIQYLVEVCQYSMVDKAKRLAKYIQTDEDGKASTTIAANSIVKFILQDDIFLSFAKKEAIGNYINQETVKHLFVELTNKEKYKEYAKIETPTLEQDKEIIAYIIKKVFPVVKDFENHLEELFINYYDDNTLILHILSKNVESFNENVKNNFFQTLNVWEEERKFAQSLLAKTIQYSDELNAYIEPSLKNWEMDRIAFLDLVLMKMAVCELKYFPTIPVKVTINEYIDISKLYSTPKSKDFVNGVLDKIKKKMLENNEIKKHGRGLME